ncbi:hypothetical protein [Actinomadura sp. 6N118]|uniref:hypothetical protein n=1 Tax=Actinomadura sp. 6N118 TaxID=3375151 RepID=UPI0037BC0BAF
MMLINPYPYGAEAFRSLCITVRRTPASGVSRARERDIYEQYEHSQFKEPWPNADEIDPKMWEHLGAPAPTIRHRQSRRNPRTPGSPHIRTGDHIVNSPALKTLAIVAMIEFGVIIGLITGILTHTEGTNISTAILQGAGAACGGPVTLVALIMTSHKSL